MAVLDVPKAFFGPIISLVGNLPFVSHLTTADEAVPLPEDAPSIGISGVAADSKSVQAMMTLIAAQGAKPVFLGYHKERLHGIRVAPLEEGGLPVVDREAVDRAVADDLRGLSGIVVMGNNADIDPRKYGHSNDEKKSDVEIDYARAAYEESMIEIALKRGMPQLGVCGGHQRLNVGGRAEEQGTLHQHVKNQSQGDIPAYIPVQRINIVENTRLAALGNGIRGQYAPAPGVSVEENSFHHQVVDKVREGFIASAYSEDGHIEAIEPDPNGKYKDIFALGTQWHPEFAASTLSQKIASGFCQAARGYAKAYNIAPLSEIEAIQESAYSATPFIRSQQAKEPSGAGVETWQKYLELREKHGRQRVASL